jgi:hypothetical protein
MPLRCESKDEAPSLFKEVSCAKRACDAVTGREFRVKISSHDKH